MGQHHQPSLWTEVFLQAAQQGLLGLLLPVATSAQVFHRQSCKRESQTPGEFVAGAHHPGVLTVTDQGSDRPSLRGIPRAATRSRW